MSEINGITVSEGAVSSGSSSSVSPKMTEKVCTIMTADEKVLARMQIPDARDATTRGPFRPLDEHNVVMTYDEKRVMEDAKEFARAVGFGEHTELLQKGALAARFWYCLDTVDGLDKKDREALSVEGTSRWTQTFCMWFLGALCAASAIVQGMDQSAVNGAQRFYFKEFNVRGEWEMGFINGAPYLFAAALGCWLTKPLNAVGGRRGCISFCCFLTAMASIWQALSPTKASLIVARAVLGVAIGAKSTTTPLFATESAPTPIRGALAMMWQMWTAFGIMCGFATSLAYQNITSTSIPGLNWRLMLGTNAIFPALVCGLVWLCPESPRWYIKKNRYDAAYRSLLRLRRTPLLAARDIYVIHKGLESDTLLAGQSKGPVALLETLRNRRATMSAFFVMFMQQFCGVNVVAYYSTMIFIKAGWSETRALLASFGAGAINFIFALPAFFTIDTFGRRNLLLFSFPSMGICMLFTGLSFLAAEPEVRTAMVATGIYLFMMCYSPGEGPVPFTYSAEAFPLQCREWGMAFATSTTWGFNFILALTWPALEAAFKPEGAFSWYAGWNFFAFLFTFFCLPETKGYSLEQLDGVFSVPLKTHARRHWELLVWWVRKALQRRDVGEKPPLMQDYAQISDRHAAIKMANV